VDIERKSVHVWFAYDKKITCPDLLNKYLLLLNDDEYAQYLRFYFDSHRHQYLVTRALVKTTLSRYHPHIAPCQWRFSKNRYGKPAIMNDLNTPFYFNISHTNGVVVLAVTRENEIGVDVEWARQHEEIKAIAQNYLSHHEISVLQALAETQQRVHFFELWTLKEAYIKACGKGMSIPLDQFYFQFSKQNIDIRFVQPNSLSSESFQFWKFQFGSEYQGALAIKHRASDQNYSMLHFKEVIPLTESESNIDIPYFPGRLS
jgi:4'-phosphopantetheinyl transferase